MDCHWRLSNRLDKHGAGLSDLQDPFHVIFSVIPQEKLNCWLWGLEGRQCLSEYIGNMFIKLFCI